MKAGPRPCSLGCCRCRVLAGEPGGQDEARSARCSREPAPGELRRAAQYPWKDEGACAAGEAAGEWKTLVDRAITHWISRESNSGTVEHRVHGPGGRGCLARSGRVLPARSARAGRRSDHRGRRGHRRLAIAAEIAKENRWRGLREHETVLVHLSRGAGPQLETREIQNTESLAQWQPHPRVPLGVQMACIP